MYENKIRIQTKFHCKFQQCVNLLQTAMSSVMDNDYKNM